MLGDFNTIIKIGETVTIDVAEWWLFRWKSQRGKGLALNFDYFPLTIPWQKWIIDLSALHDFRQRWGED